MMFGDDWFVWMTLRVVFHVAVLRGLHVVTGFFLVSGMEVFASDIFAGDKYVQVSLGMIIDTVKPSGETLKQGLNRDHGLL